MDLEEILNIIKGILFAVFCGATFVGLLLVLSIPLYKIQCNKFNELYKTNYTHSEWWWNSEAIKLSFAGTKNDK